jgi:hypothetical protein
MVLAKQAEWTPENVIEKVDGLIALGFCSADYRAAQIAFCQWISSCSQEHWLWAVQAYNWGYGPLPMMFMLETEECDFAVAKSIFWFSEFDYYLESDEQWLKTQNLREAKTLKFIIDRELSLGFPRSNLNRLEWGGPNKDPQIAASCFNENYEFRPIVPESLLCTSDVALCRKSDDFAKLEIPSTWEFRELSTFFWNYK